jgi:hypothetical protein
LRFAAIFHVDRSNPATFPATQLRMKWSPGTIFRKSR